MVRLLQLHYNLCNTTNPPVRNLLVRTQSHSVPFISKGAQSQPWLPAVLPCAGAARGSQRCQSPQNRQTTPAHGCGSATISPQCKEQSQGNPYSVLHSQLPSCSATALGRLALITSQIFNHHTRNVHPAFHVRHSPGSGPSNWPLTQQDLTWLL